MSQPNVYYGVTHAGASVLLLARVENADGTPVLPADVANVTYTVFELRPCDSPSRMPVAGHESVSLPPAALLFPSPQLDAPWNADATGYTFRHELDATASPPFPTAGRRYLIRYELTSSVGQPIVFTFQIEAI